MIKYTFREDFITVKNAAKADPQKIGERLAKIAGENGGELRIDPVVEDARNLRSPLHKHFEWDDKVAAEAHRREQARELIRIIRVVDDDDNQPTRRAFLSVSTEQGVAYHTLGEVMTSRDLQIRVTRQALRDLDAYEKRYREIDEICEMVRVGREGLQERLGRLQAEERPSA